MTFTTTVTAPSGGSPTGSITYSLNNGTSISNLFGGLSNAGGSSSTGTAFSNTLAAGTYTVTAGYSGGGTLAAANSNSVTITVNKAGTSTGIVGFMQGLTTVAFTATVSPTAGGGTPTGPLTFYLDGTPILSTTLSSGQATFSSSTLAVGNHTLFAAYGGNTGFNSSLGGTTFAISSGRNLTSATSSINPSLPVVLLPQGSTWTMPYTQASMRFRSWPARPTMPRSPSTPRLSIRPVRNPTSRSPRTRSTMSWSSPTTTRRSILPARS